MIGADTETAHGDQSIRCGERLGVQPRTRPDAEYVDPAQTITQRIARERAIVPLDVGIARLRKHALSGFVHAFEQEDAGAVGTVERRHGGPEKPSILLDAATDMRRDRESR